MKFKQTLTPSNKNTAKSSVQRMFDRKISVNVFNVTKLTLKIKNEWPYFSIKMKTFKSNFMTQIKKYITSKGFCSSTASSHRKEFIMTCNTWHTRLRYVADSDM